MNAQPNSDGLGSSDTMYFDQMLQLGEVEVFGIKAWIDKTNTTDNFSSAGKRGSIEYVFMKSGPRPPDFKVRIEGYSFVNVTKKFV